MCVSTCINLYACMYIGNLLCLCYSGYLIKDEYIFSPTGDDE